VHGKRMVAESMYAKGKAFLGAAVLLRQKGGYEYVVLHLLCQGIEIVLKGLLLAIDYDKFKPKLKQFGHDLLKVTDAATSAARLPALRPRVRAELESLNQLYSRHLLRYGSGHDILVDPNTIPSRLVLRRMVALLRLVERKGLIHGAVI
jgi:hypothetical protein